MICIYSYDQLYKLICTILSADLTWCNYIEECKHSETARMILLQACRLDWF